MLEIEDKNVLNDINQGFGNRAVEGIMKKNLSMSLEVQMMARIDCPLTQLGIDEKSIDGKAYGSWKHKPMSSLNNNELRPLYCVSMDIVFQIVMVETGVEDKQHQTSLRVGYDSSLGNRFVARHFTRSHTPEASPWEASQLAASREASAERVVK
ncbi:hypothetical protein K435DRAFT_807835 [Dendrothele bispora CBS 962.96]|uniref:Uncharacterized protein n=1 Tax=Dendrothele bispora (strain CBS 962.96) TaxID=1314807 RepID=A0A4S8L3F8_DENBC|nr:hypothetical protein K435DRAFT_807835 [Dendrothele bispora CBS 962.96]